MREIWTGKLKHLWDDGEDSQSCAYSKIAISIGVAFGEKGTARFFMEFRCNLCCDKGLGEYEKLECSQNYKF